MSKKNLQEETIKALMSESKLNEAKDDEIVLVANGTVYWQGTKSEWETREDELRALVQDVASEDGISIDTDEVDAYTVTEWENLNEGKKVEDVTPDKEYQGIKYFDNQDGYCPICNAKLHYEPVEYAGDDVVYYGWKCDKCGAQGEAYFKQSFMGHSIYDDNFDLIELPFGNDKKEELFNNDVNLNVSTGDIGTGNNLDLGGLGEIAGLFASEENLKESESNLFTIKYIDDDAFYNLDNIMKLEKKYNLNIGVKNTEQGVEVTVTGTKDNIRAFNKEYGGINAEEITDDDFEAMKSESKKVEATDRNIDKDKVLNMKYADLPDMCYGLLPSDNSVIVIKKGETGYYETDYGTPENPEEFVAKMNEKLGVTPEQRMVMELRSMSGNWVLSNEGDKKEEAVEELSAPDYLRKAFEVEVEYWLKALVDENSNDDIGKKSQEVLDDKTKLQEIVNELVDGSDDLWEDIHRRIEELAGLHHRESSRVNESKKVTEAYNYNWRDDIEELENTEANDELAYAFAENLIETDPDYANYDDPWDVLSQIIYIWKIAKRSRLYDFLLKWYGSEEEMKKHIRSFYETSDAIYFETGAGYSFFSADLLGGTADGNAAREFDDFVKNGGKKVESRQVESKSLNWKVLDWNRVDDYTIKGAVRYNNELYLFDYNSDGGYIHLVDASGKSINIEDLNDEDFINYMQNIELNEIENM